MRNFNDSILRQQLAVKDRQLILAAKCGKVLLEQKEELERQNEQLSKEYDQKIEHLEQERYELKIHVEQLRTEYENKIAELYDDVSLLRQELNINRRDIRQSDERNACILNELNEQNQKLSNDLQKSKTSENRLQDQLKIARNQSDARCQAVNEHMQDLTKIKQQMDDLSNHYCELERHCRHIREERDILSNRLEESDRTIEVLEEDCRNNEESKLLQQKEMADMQALNAELIKRLDGLRFNQSSFMQEIEDYAICATRANSTIDYMDDFECDELLSLEHDHNLLLSDDSNDNYSNEKCLLDELLQTEEFKREIVYVYKQLRSLCFELVSHYSLSSTISDTADKVYDRLQNGCLIGVLYELKNLIKDIVEREKEATNQLTEITHELDDFKNQKEIAGISSASTDTTSYCSAVETAQQINSSSQSSTSTTTHA
ncbi:unnamed protein product [Didymodactylos carnosus]|uniref:Uncharacterized protein n=1 Tax=Didymodactylos carnosus TaxID=1234261 RepID=A0A813XTT1_9BILA|nr:unnamed protein product [Didymodactylos carnosus]CAF0875320.1 unnamed protein product [Didymodactylos carnosus]CAF3603404.1 unnamed protein product [Didymodactylos carnosus]CAF3662230.1 unnamed protein product [Didymodactylos carnosus]